MILIVAFLAGVQAALIASLNTRAALPTGLFIALHVGLTAGALAACLRDPGRGLLNSGGIAIGAAFGPLGILLLSLRPFSLPVLRRKKRLTHGKQKTSRKLAIDGAATSPIWQTLEGQLIYPESAQLESLAVTLSYGEPAARHQALQTAVRSFEPRMSSIVALALQDDDQTIRALAAAASAQVADDVAVAFAELEMKASNHVGIEELAPVLLSLSAHALHNELLPRAQQMMLARTCLKLLEQRTCEAGTVDLRKDMQRAARDLKSLLPAPAPATSAVQATLATSPA